MRRPLRSRRPDSVQPSRFRFEQLEDRRLLAETPVLVADLNSTFEPSNPRDFTRVGDTLYYVVSTGVAGTNSANTELWREVDGIRSMVRNIASGNQSSDPQLLTVVGDLLYFTATDLQHGRELCRTDGTFEGTYQVWDLEGGAGGAGITAIEGFRGDVFFLRSGRDLYRYNDDGVRPLFLGRANTNELVAAGDEALLFSEVDPVLGTELFASNGTVAGTGLLKNIRALAGSSLPQGFYEWQGHVYFSARSVPGVEGVLWRSDGTEAGTQLVSTGPFGDGMLITSVGDKLAILAKNGLFFSDGTDAGTRQVTLPAGMNFGIDTRSPERFVGAGGKVYFYPRTAAGFEVWTSDGTTEGTQLLRDIEAGPGNSNATLFTANGHEVFFVADSTEMGSELWRTDGTTGGTIPLTDFSTSTVDVPINELFVDEGSLHFIARGSQLWRTNGTLASTIQEAELGFSGAGVEIDDFFAVGSTLLFVKRDTTSPALWKSDGTSSGTAVLHADIRDIGDDTPFDWNGATYFAARTDDAGMELWKTDGTASGTVLVRDIYLGIGDASPGNFFVFGGQLYFSAGDAAHGVELWRTDGSFEGTVLVQDIRAGADDSAPSDFAELNGLLYFAAAGSIHGNELWRTDGSAAGAVMVRDLNPGGASSDPRQLTVIGQQLFMQTVNGTGLWKCDGTLAGTRPVLYGGPAADNLTAFDGELFYTDGFGGLWNTDGTEFGSEFIQTTGGIDRREGITIFDGAMYFAAKDELDLNYQQLWRSDGTTAGSVKVVELGLPGSQDSNVQQLAVSGEDLFFLVNDGVTGQELWQTNGTTIGTELAFDLRPGPLGSDLSFLTDVAGNLFFAGNDGFVGNGLWTLANSDDIVPPTVAGMYIGAAPLEDGDALLERPLVMTFSFSETLSEIGGAGGARSAINRFNYRLLDGGADVSSQIDFASAQFHEDRGAYEVTLGFTHPLTNGNYTLVATAALRDLAGNDLDGDDDGAAGGDFSIDFEVRTTIAIGEEFRINQTTVADQRTHGTTPQAVAADADGDFVATWTSYHQDGDAGGIYARRYQSDGQAIGNEFRVNTTTAGTQRNATIAMDDDGDFVITWSSDGQDGDGYGVYAQRFGADGTPQGDEFRVNQATAGHQRFSLVAIDAIGNFAVTWTGADAETLGVYLRRFDANGNALGDESLVNETQTGAQRFSSIAWAPDGRIAVVWSGPSELAQGDEVFGRLYAADGSPTTGEFRINDLTSGTQQAAVVAMDDAANFVVAWQSTTGADGGDIYLRRFDATAGPLSGDVVVPAVISGTQRSPSLAVDSDGDFAVAWSSGNQDGSGYGTYYRKYAASGLGVTAALPVNVETQDQQIHPTVALDDDGEMLVVWSSLGQDGDGYGVYGRRFAPASPLVGDTNGDLKVDVVDLNNVRNTFGQSGPDVAGDTNGDDVVNVEDLNAVRNNFGASAAQISIAPRPDGTQSEHGYSHETALPRKQNIVAVWDQAILEFLDVKPAKSRFR